MQHDCDCAMPTTTYHVFFSLTHVAYFSREGNRHGKNGIQESNLNVGHNRTDKFGAHKKRMPIIKCRCGFKILVVPDLKAMNRTIKNHLAEHKQADYDLAFDSLEKFLTEQILKAASKMNLPNMS